MVTTLRFDRFELQIEQRRLLRDGVEVPLRAKAFDLLVALTERAGELVTKDDLLDRVWPGVIVEENNITAQMAALRRALQAPLIVTVPGHGYRFVGAASPVDTSTVPEPAVPTAAREASYGLPRQRLFGREALLAQLSEDIVRPGVVLTLVGPGGVGKTALARVLASREHDAATWIELGPLTAARQLEPEVLRSLGLESASDCVAAVAGLITRQPRLIIVDNAEHLVDAVALLVSALTDACPNARLVVTSQQPLGIRHERVVRVDPLGYVVDAQGFAPAVALLLDRVRAADPRFALVPGAGPLLQSLCASLDGLPLALEMAAARIPLLGLQRVHDAMNERFNVLRHRGRDKPQRHLSLQATLDWSHGLLDPAEKAAFQSLAVCSDGFSLDLAMDVVGDEDDPWGAVDLLAVLVERSLVASDHADPPRYRLLESTREFALDRLVDSGVEADARGRLVRGLERLFALAEPDPVDDVSGRMRRDAMREIGNVRACLPWARDAAPTVAISLAVSACMVARFSSWRLEAADWLAALEPLMARDDVDPRLKARWWLQHATQLLFRARPEAAEIALKAADVNRAVGDEMGLFWSLIAAVRALVRQRPRPENAVDKVLDEVRALIAANPGWPIAAQNVALGTQAFIASERHDFESALTHHLAELTHGRAAGLRLNVGAAEHNVAHALMKLGRHQQGLSRMRSWLAQADAGESDVNIAYAQILVVRLHLACGDLAAARAALEPALAVCRAQGLPGIGILAALTVGMEGRPRAAAILLGHACKAFDVLGQPLPDDDDELVQLQTLLDQRVETSDRASLHARGLSMDHLAADRLLTSQLDA